MYQMYSIFGGNNVARLKTVKTLRVLRVRQLRRLRLQSSMSAETDADALAASSPAQSFARSPSGSAGFN